MSLLHVQVQFRARNEMQNQIIAQEAEQITWLSRSAHVLNVSARLCCMRDRLLHSSLWAHNTAVSSSASGHKTASVAENGCAGPADYTQHAEGWHGHDGGHAAGRCRLSSASPCPGIPVWWPAEL